MPCGPENDFMPDINLAKDSDIIMFCNPNNPTVNPKPLRPNNPKPLHPYTLTPLHPNNPKP
jgi:hypothetical protein